MLKEAAKVLQSGRQIAIPPNLFAAVRERRSCNPIRRLRVQQQSLARTPGQTRLDFNLSGRARAGDPTTTCTDSTHVCVPHPQTECVIGGLAGWRSSVLTYIFCHLPPSPVRLAESWLEEFVSGKKELLCRGAAGPQTRAARSRLSIFQLSLSPQHWLILPVGRRIKKSVVGSEYPARSAICSPPRLKRWPIGSFYERENNAPIQLA